MRLKNKEEQKANEVRNCFLEADCSYGLTRF